MANKFRPRQRLRVIVNGVGLFIMAGKLSSIFATSDHYAAVREVITEMERDNLTGYGTTINGIQVQVDKLND